MHKAYLGLGGNLGDRLWHLAEAVRRLHSPPSLEVLAVSPVYESAAVGNTAQPDFLNLVIEVATTLSPQDLLAECLRVEAALGRVRRERWGPRTADIDVLLYDQMSLRDEVLSLPHPRMTERSFVLTPLADIAPEMAVGGDSIRTLAARLDQTTLRKIGALDWVAGKPDNG